MQHSRESLCLYVYGHTILTNKVAGMYVLTLFWYIKRAGLRGAVEVRARPASCLIDQGAIGVGVILNLEEWRLQFANWGGRGGEN